MSSLKKFILWLLTLTLLIIIGVSDVFALETKTIYSVNNNGTLSSANTYNYGYLTGGGTQGIARASVGNVINGVSYGFNFSFYENVVLNKSYTLVINFMDVDLLKSFNSSMVQVSTCNGDTCNNNIIISVLKSSNTNNSNKLTIEFNPITTGNIIYVNLGSSNPITGVSTFGIRSVTLDSSNQNEDIMNNANQNANNIINNQNSNTNDIINSQESSASSIIDNQNSSASAIIDSSSANADRIIEENQKNFNTIKYCNNLYNYNTLTSNIYYGGNISNSHNRGYSYNNNTITANNVDNYSTIGFKFNNNGSSKLYISGKTSLNQIYIYIKYDNSEQFRYPMNIINNDFSYVINLSNNFDYLNIGIGPNNGGGSYTISDLMISNNNESFCVFGSSTSTNKLDEQTDAINGVKDVLTDTDVDTSSLNDAVGWLPPGPVDSILNLPLSMLNSLLTSLNKTCTPLSVPLPFLNEDMEIPCLTTIFNKINGFNSFWSWVGAITSVLMLYKYLLSLYYWVDKTLFLKSSTDGDFGGVV